MHHFKKRLCLALVLATANCVPIRAQSPFPVEVFYAPSDNLERRDVELIRSARKTIDFAAYTFSSFTIIDSLADAGRRGVRIRILLDPSQLRQRQEAAVARIKELSRIPSITVRVKRGRDLMHLKSYSIDGSILRSGSANFTPSGLKRQNNDLIVIRSPTAVERFTMEFSNVFDHADPVSF